jgi:hypothetical protein
MDEMMNWVSLGTLAGSTAAVLLIVQYAKPLFPRLDTRVLALMVAAVLLQLATAFTGGDLQQHVIAVLNSFLVASSAMGLYQVTFSRSDAIRREDGGAESGGNG